MPRQTSAPCRARHVMIFDEDWEYLEGAYGSGGGAGQKIGVSAAIRALVHAGVENLRQRERDLLAKRPQSFAGRS